MAFAINQNFDLKSKRKDFVRQELTLADLKTTRDADYPDDYTVTIGGKIYIFNSSNSVDSTLGRWREFAGGGGGSITPGSGLETSSGKLQVRIGSGLIFDGNGTLKVNLYDVSSNDETAFVPLQIGSNSLPGIAVSTNFVTQSGKLFLNLGSALKEETNGRVTVKTAPNSGMTIGNNGLGINVNSSLAIDSDNKLSLSSCTVYRRNKAEPIAQESVIVSTNGLNFKISTGLAVDEEGYLYVDVNSIINA